MKPRLEPYDHPAAWKASTFQDKEEFVVELGGKHVDALARAVQKLKAKGFVFRAIPNDVHPLL